MAWIVFIEKAIVATVAVIVIVIARMTMRKINKPVLKKIMRTTKRIKVTITKQEARV